PLNNIFLSALIAALPIFCFLICLMGLKMKSYTAGLYSVIVAIILAIFVHKMPATVAVASAGFVILSGFY
ncbi:L-lactate permease, partial [Lysinibacillus sp. D4A1_S13]|uniref:L-lactate permease n=1 Tax=Lysinibacillus sp. D4A1_S13 TaxID=2941228 RepID=UPI0020BEDB6B